MKQLLRPILHKFFPQVLTLFHLYKHGVRDKSSYLNVTGWTRSMTEERPCQLDGSPLPWMNYPVIGLFQKRLNKEMRLFEYGSGYSTLFFSELVASVTSLEYDIEWYERISKDLPKNAKVLLVKNDVDGSYCRAIHQTEGLFDVVVVDGRDRVNCIKQSIAKLQGHGVILLDDSQRERYQEGIDHAVREGFKRLDLEGMKPGKYGLERTTIFYRDGNCFNL